MKKPVFRAIFAGMLLTFALGTQGADQAQPEDLTRLLKLRLGTDQVAPPTETGIEGVYMTRFANKFAYLIDGGRYVFIGDLVDLEAARNLTELSRRELIVKELAAFDEKKRVIFPAENEELAVLSVFTDTSCGYCQQLHSELPHLRKAGISVHYYPYPRGGNRGPGYHDLKKVWCADDRQEAMNIAKSARPGEIGGSEDCESAQYIDDGYALGNRIGVNGTPSLYASDGTRFNGYVPYQELIPQLLNNNQ